MAMIQKALITGFGDESKITVVQEEIPAPSANEVQVAVEFSGFSGADINMRRGTYPMQKKPPFTPGYCFVGRVTATSDRLDPGLEYCLRHGHARRTRRSWRQGFCSWA